MPTRKRQSISRGAARAKIRSGTIERLVSELGLQPDCESQTAEAADLGSNGMLHSFPREWRIGKRKSRVIPAYFNIEE